jgi:hypothetical protein
LRVLILAVFVLVNPVLAGLPVAQAASPCDGIQNAFQYNECLARQAPGRALRVRGAAGTGGADPEASVPARRRIVDQARPANGVAIQKRTGRVRATIDPWGGVRAAPSRKARRR